MKEEYKIPVMYIYEFEVSESIMDSGSGCDAGFDCPDGICVSYTYTSYI